jgi:hypothetical protein
MAAHKHAAARIVKRLSAISSPVEMASLRRECSEISERSFFAATTQLRKWGMIVTLKNPYCKRALLAGLSEKGKQIMAPLIGEALDEAVLHQLLIQILSAYHSTGIHDEGGKEDPAYITSIQELSSNDRAKNEEPSSAGEKKEGSRYGKKKTLVTGKPSNSISAKETTPSSRQEKAVFRRMVMYAEEYLSPKYWGMTPLERDVHFADGYLQTYHKWFKALPDGPITQVCRNYPSIKNKEQKLCRNFRHARVAADNLGAIYEDYLDAIFEWYAEDNPNPRYKIPYPWLLAGEGARRIYEEKFLNNTSKALRFRRDENFPEYLPENYRATDLQNKYFKRVMVDIARVAEAQGRPVGEVLTEQIRNKLVHKEFAEDKELNAYVPDYHYETWLKNLSGVPGLLRRA